MHTSNFMSECRFLLISAAGMGYTYLQVALCSIIREQNDQSHHLLCRLCKDVNFFNCFRLYQPLHLSGGSREMERLIEGNALCST